MLYISIKTIKIDAFVLVYTISYHKGMIKSQTLREMHVTHLYTTVTCETNRLA